jgi:hypothetical protein
LSRRPKNGVAADRTVAEVLKLERSADHSLSLGQLDPGKNPTGYLESL